MHHRRNLRPHRLALLLALTAAGCSSGAELPPTEGPDAQAPGDAGAVEGPEAAVLDVHCSSARPSFAADVNPIFHGNCGGGENCHGPPTYGEIVNASLEGAVNCDGGKIDVVPGDLAKSYLMSKLTGVGLCGMYDGTMPPGQMLPAADVQTIADWICEGAPDN